MKAIDREIVTQIRYLRRNGSSYKEIAKKLSVGVGTSYKYARDVKMTLTGKRRLECRQARGRLPKEVSIVRSLTVEKVRIIAHALFDGSVTVDDADYAIKYTNASWGLIRQFIGGMRKIYGMEPRDVRFNKGKNHPWWEVKYRSKRVVEDLLRYSISYSTSNNVGLPKGVARNREFIRAFLRAFWDDEGSISHEGDLIASSKSQQLTHDIKQLHEKLSVDCSVYHKGSYFALRVKRTPDNFLRFQKEIGFGESIVVHGKSIGLKKSAVLANFLAKYRS